jgi:hypothetical protein
MKNRIVLLLAACAATSAPVSVCSAQPSMIAVPVVAPDMTHSGQKVAGLIYDANAQKYVPYIWERGAGTTRIEVPSSPQDGVSCSDDGSVLVTTLPNADNWGDLNCFAGYCFGDMQGCTPGDPLPPPSPCEVPQIAQRWTAATGWTSVRSFDRVLDPATGRYYGGTRCDYDINPPNDLSGDGRYVVGGAYYALLDSSNCQNGGPGFGLCGDFYAYRYDSVTGEFLKLSIPADHHTSRADRCNTDGSVITGYDLLSIQNPDGTTDNIRQTVVWRNNVETVLDAHFGAKDNAAVNGPGTAVAQGASAETIAELFPGVVGVRLVRWTFQGGAWVPQNLGRPGPQIDPNSGVAFDCTDMWVDGVSEDGNTIVGTASYQGNIRPFLYKSTINGGVPVDLMDYIRSVDPGSPLVVTDFLLSQTYGVSSDGNAIMLSYFDNRNTCEFGGPSLQTGGQAVLYLGGAACEAPQIALQPGGWTQDFDIRLGVAINAFASGSWPLSYQWQREDPQNPGAWIDLTDDCMNFPPSDVYPWAFEGTRTRQLRVGTGEGGGGRGGHYRVVVTNPCGSVTSDPATVTFVSGACCMPFGVCSVMYQGDCATAGGSWGGPGSDCATGCRACGSADFNCDGDIGTDADIEGFFACLAGNCPSQPCTNSADFNGDGDVGTDADIEAFFRVLAGGNC